MLYTLIGAIILSINIQVGLNMHPYEDIGDASSSLRGSTSSNNLNDLSSSAALLESHATLPLGTQGIEPNTSINKGT